ncbi:GH17223 [Drosophila grimshawi]|uniref:GH17223 n=1 Tax=Drosophila grimshawi TaxID=7222 RepID=B4JGM4_DROGR|nr:GH17223 [Drosophila grimshawi]
MTLPLFWRIFSKFGEVANPIAPVIKFCELAEFAVPATGAKGEENNGRNSVRERDDDDDDAL